MYRPRRKPSIVFAVIGLAMLALPPPATSQEIDNRPIYYLMVKSLEDGFQAYNVALAEDLKMREATLRERNQSARAELAEQLAALEAERAEREERFKTQRETLNRRIDDINERIVVRDGRIHEERRAQKLHSPRIAKDPKIESLTAGVAEQLSELETIRGRYLEQLAATRKARAELTGQFEEYMSAGDPLALEIRALDEDWQRFAEDERRKLKELADVYAVDYAAYEKWLEGESEVLEELSAGVARALETDREKRARHEQIETELRDLIDQYNGLVEVHNRAGPDDPRRDARAVEFGKLENRIAALQEALTEAREAVLAAHAELTQRNEEFGAKYERFITRKRERDRALAADLAALNASRMSVETAIEARREKVDAQIRSLEARISGELRDSRENLETLDAAMTRAFGRNHEGLDAAIRRVVESNDDGLLYTTAGTARYDLSRPQTAEVYKAAERLDADRRRIDARIAAIEQSNGTVQSGATRQTRAAGDLEREHAALASERQQLLEAFATFARETQDRAGALEAKMRALDAEYADARARLGELYSARAGVTRSEMQAIQAVLVAAAKGLPGGAPPASDHARLVADLEDKAGRMGSRVEASMLAPHALMDHIDADLPDVEADAGPSGWRDYAGRRVTGSRELTGTHKAALAMAWLARLSRQADFKDVATALDASGAVDDGHTALARLFVAGVLDHASIVEQQLADGGAGIQVGILGRAYQLAADGSLERLPDG